MHLRCSTVSFLSSDEISFFWFVRLAEGRLWSRLRYNTFFSLLLLLFCFDTINLSALCPLDKKFTNDVFLAWKRELDWYCNLPVHFGSSRRSEYSEDEAASFSLTLSLSLSLSLCVLPFFLSAEAYLSREEGTVLGFTG